MTSIQPFKAHGRVYNSEEEAIARIKEINELIFKIGVSDGRLTEWLDIEEALEEAKNSSDRFEDDRYAREAHYAAVTEKAEMIRNAERELSMLEASLGGKREEGAGFPTHRITWFDKDGKRHVSRYSTDTGFLKAYLRMMKSSNIDVWDAV